MENVLFGIRRLQPDESKHTRIKDGVPETDWESVKKQHIFYHKQRAQLMNELIDKYNLKVEENEGWHKMNAEEPHEYVEIILAIINAGVLTAIINTFQSWINSKKIKNVTVKLPAREFSV